ncbi:hypothetical protein EV401DRAFT_1973413 [Pisolithus croceorrhizus]|nr:hypothetical protein EV401DRAFT_1973413 [Pisolithus croceorrhizus]
MSVAATSLPTAFPRHRFLCKSVYIRTVAVSGVIYQFLDSLLLSQEVYRIRETRRHVQLLTTAKTLQRKAVGFLIRQMDDCIPLVRAMDEAKPRTGLVYLSPDDPCLLLGEWTCFK